MMGYGHVRVFSVVLAVVLAVVLRVFSSVFSLWNVASYNSTDEMGNCLDCLNPQPEVETPDPVMTP